MTFPEMRPGMNRLITSHVPQLGYRTAGFESHSLHEEKTPTRLVRRLPLHRWISLHRAYTWMCSEGAECRSCSFNQTPALSSSTSHRCPSSTADFHPRSRSSTRHALRRNTYPGISASYPYISGMMSYPAVPLNASSGFFKRPSICWMPRPSNLSPCGGRFVARHHDRC